MKKLIAARMISQAFFLSLFIYILWSTTYPLKGTLKASTFFNFSPLIMIITSISERVILPGLAASCFILILTALFGRFFCGWVCPLGSAIDIAAVFTRRRRKEDDRFNAKAKQPKFLILAVIAIASLFGIQLAWIMDPIVIMGRFTSLNLIPAITATVNLLLIFTIKAFNYNSAIQDFYRTLKSGILGINVYYFSHSGIIFLFFLTICAFTLFKRRAWCRMACPLGAIYALAGRFAILHRVVEKCISCGRCKSDCRMGAIRDDMEYSKGECVLCMDCVYDCPQHATAFRWSSGKIGAAPGKAGGITRRQFFLLAGSSLFLTGFNFKDRSAFRKTDIIRPPAALKEDHFLDRCVRCGNCMKVCITNGLQPVLLQSGLDGIWTPQLVPEIGYCEYNCVLCGHTCPTGAIPALSLQEKHEVRLGVAEIDRSICIPWAQGGECIVCQEHCPIPQKAIKVQKDVVGDEVILKPYIDERLCVGCGICQSKCPVRPIRAVKVSSRNSYRT